ncbi:RagB/SusD family nutrient uptake outer membrane protein [Winogradskyella psychrotolerans]|uniref:RagB/SusD family nutrient uptake outer membrane protein n=1 Tax=Winogradskyella psychrotolerans TaxID=1344585 RepID=UPI001C06A7BA|nr:RagB/SusD family nutrient uptake outer membrane protein [Winogradskyella psychrotolerans]MBU2927771.1 RagB/SusD family nutrient uptake outer membrane protein [Winogradskyella psychrotolerans]
MKNIFKKLFLSLAIMTVVVSCHDDLDQSPIDPDSFTEEDVFANAEEAKSALAKVYASLALTGQQGPSGQADISNVDEGFSQFTRMLFNLNELTTDNAVVAWGDAGLQDLHGMYWTSSNDFTDAMYNRLAQSVSFANSFIENASGLGDDVVIEYIAEARFIRAYAYYNLIDLYGDVPLVTQIETSLPSQNTREEVFNFIEAELLEIQNDLAGSGSNEYGRVDEVAAWALLSKLYLNAEVWTATSKYNEAVTYSEAVINSTYSIHTTDVNNNGSAYDDLFLADNNTNGSQIEFIFTANFDGINSQTYGGSTFLVHAAIGGSMDASAFGVNGGWGGNRTTSALVNKMGAGDSRAMFYTDGQSLEISDLTSFTDGYAVTKFSNIDSEGNQGKDASGNFTDIDLPLIRLAEIYLNYAEATLRGGSGNTTTAVNLINELRERAYGDTSGNILTGDLTLDFVLDERARELYWEGQRRTDLVRYNYFTTNSYLWPFKGNSANGTSVSDFRNLFPIPSNTILSNPNLTQNTGY